MSCRIKFGIIERLSIEEDFVNKLQKSKFPFLFCFNFYSVLIKLIVKVNGRITTLDEKISTLDERISTLDGRISTLEDKMTRCMRYIADLTNDRRRRRNFINICY